MAKTPFRITMLIVSSITGAIQGADYYVAENGTDGNSGRIASPFLTVQHGASVLEAGDTLYIRAGSYPCENVEFPNSGNPGNPIVVAGYPGDDRPYLKAKGGGNGGFLFQTPGQGNYVIKDLEIANGGYGGIWIRPSALPRVHDIRVENCEIHAFSKSPIRVENYGVERMLIENCIVHDAFDTEGGMDFRVNTLDYSPGAGSRQVIIRNTISYDNHHNQQASGIIVQESCEHFVYINNLAYHNGEIGFASKAGGYNIYVNNKSYDQSKAGYYMRSPNKDFGGGNIIEGESSQYLLLNNVGIGKHVLAGDQGPARIWDGANVWMYNNTLVSMRIDDGLAFSGAPFTISAGYKYMTLAYAKNNIVYQVFNRFAILFDGKYVDKNNNRRYSGTGNMFFGYGIRIHGVRNLSFEEFFNNSNAAIDLDDYAISEDAGTSFEARPLFHDFDTSVDTRPHDLRIAGTSPGIDAGVPYGPDDPNDYPRMIETFLKAYSMDSNPDHAFEEFGIMTDEEKRELRSFLRTAYLYDKNLYPRSGNPDIGAYEHVSGTDSTPPAAPANLQVN
ncbi:MAG: right-handed parallel beta-helix repeat-containing protein [Kiritimatiellae bacterium]|nr:right-handed parallel beta-helix repeat-containing protein [Kiritimatiellia bacterium]